MSCRGSQKVRCLAIAITSTVLASAYLEETQAGLFHAWTSYDVLFAGTRHTIRMTLRWMDADR